jgi:hypothetical protein
MGLSEKTLRRLMGPRINIKKAKLSGGGDPEKAHGPSHKYEGRGLSGRTLKRFMDPHINLKEGASPGGHSEGSWTLT